MITTVKIATAPAKTTEFSLESAKNHPLHLESLSNVACDGSAHYTTVFGKGNLEFARYTFVRNATGPIVLASVKGNLPTLLWGHEGRLIQSQQELELALTRLRWLGSGLVAKNDVSLLLPHFSKTNTGHISELGLAIQLEDPRGALLNAARFSTVNGSAVSPVLSRERTVLPGENATWTIRPVNIQGESFTLGPWTRIECCIRDTRILGKAVRVKYSENYLLAALPFGYCLELFKRATKKTLGGGLAESPAQHSGKFADAVRRVVRKYLCAGDFHLAIQKEQAGMPAGQADTFRRQVFRKISAYHNTCLFETLSNAALDESIHQAADPDIEIAHAWLMESLGCPETADEAVSETFCGPLLLDRDDPAQRLFFNLEYGLPY